MDTSIIQVRNFRKTYGEFVAVDDISFSVSAGEIFGLLGPNGAGKTTTLECLEGLRRPDRGSLTVAGLDPARQPAHLSQVIGVQLQSGSLPGSFTPREAMKFFCAYHGVAPRFDLLERLGLHGRLDVQYLELSTGLQRRLSLALALAHNPLVLFLDEPTAGLDVASRVELHAQLRELRAAGTTIILATHDMAEAETLADRIAILLGGRLAAVDTPMAITAKGAGLTRISVRSERASLEPPDVLPPAAARQGIRDGYVIYFSQDVGPTVAAIIAHVEASGDRLIDLRVERPSLEDRFLEIAAAQGGM